MKNIRADPNEVWVQAGFQKFHAKIEIVDDLSTKENFWRRFVKKHSRTAKGFFGWNPKRDNPETTDLSSIAESVTVVCLHRS